MNVLTDNEKGVNGQLAKYIRTLLDSGLIKRVTDPEGRVRYEVTETGSRLLKECEEATSHPENGTSKLGQIDFAGILENVVKNQVTVVLPVLNEAEALVSVVREIESEGYSKILVVDGYSNDKTDEIARSVGVDVMYQHGAGKAGAVKTAIEHAETPYLLFMDGDATYDPKDIWRLLIHNEHYSHVIGVRDRKHIPSVHRFGNWVISRVFSMLFGMKTSDVCSGMYLLETAEAKKYRLEEPGFVAEIELAAQSASREQLTEVPISYRPRVGTRKLNTWRHGLDILRASVRLARRHNAILLYSGLASLSIIPAILLLTWVAYERLARNIWHSGWVLAGIMLLLVAAQAFTLASVSILTRHMERRLMHEIAGKAT